MGKRSKRRRSTSSSSEDEEIVLKKRIRRLQRKLTKCNGRSSASESDVENYRSSSGVRASVEPSETAQSFLQDDDLNNNCEVTPHNAMDQDPLEVEEVAPLRQEILHLLGKDDFTSSSLGDIIHKDLAVRWESILRKGLNEETRTTLVKKYPPIKNCALVAAPKLNLEVKAAVNDTAVKRDGRLATVQHQVGACLAALGKALTIMLGEEEKEGGSSLQLIEIISDSSRLLADVHYQESESRRNLIALKLNKDLKDTMTNAGVDGWLFGDNLSERVKVAKALEKSGRELKDSPAKPTRTKAPIKNSLNFKSPSRHQPGSRLGGQKYQFNSIRANSSKKFQQTHRNPGRSRYQSYQDKGRRDYK